MREILFRGKRADNREWIVGDVHKNEDFSKAHIHPVGERVRSFDVIPETVGQYTGLTDKNGKKIFEGDVVEILDTHIGEVVFVSGAFGVGMLHCIEWGLFERKIEDITGCKNSPCFCYYDTFVSLWELMWNYNQEENSCFIVEVIGNIHDNPELLKGGAVNE